MNDEDRQDELQKMLALKRHETPPPRFFKGFSHKVIDRLHSPEPPLRPTWWQSLGLDIDSRPVLVCASGVVVCGLLLVGLIASLRVEPPKAAPPSPNDKTHLVVMPPLDALTVPTTQLVPALSAEPLPRIGDPIVMSTPLAPKPINLAPAPKPPAPSP